MAVNYDKINWQNRVVQRPRTYTESANSDSSITHTPAPGEVVQEGTPRSAENMDHMDQGIKDCAEAINDLIATLQQIQETLASHNTRINNNQRGITDAQRVNETQSANIATLTRAHNELAEDEEALENRADSHIANRDNPHQVTKAQVELGNVPNVTTNDQKPTWTEPATNSVPVSNTDTLSTALGKIVRAVRLFYQHLTDYDNPHQVDKVDVELGNVPNVTTNDQTPTYTAAGSDQELSSGETLATAFGKLKRAVERLYAHIARTDNPHNTSLMEAAAVTLQNNWGEPDVIGTFMGNGASVGTVTVNGEACRGRQINLGFAPSKVAIIIPTMNAVLGMNENEASSGRGIGSLLTGQAIWGVAMISPGHNYYHSGCPNSSATDPPETVLGRRHGGAVVYGNGFIVQSYNLGDADTVMNMNVKNRKYTYLAWR